MNLARASQRASSVPGRKSAARLYNEIEYELALGEPDDDLERAGEQALALLKGRFPRVREAAREIEQPPSLSRQAGEAVEGMSRTGRPRWPARRSKHLVDRGVRSRTWPLENARAHPVASVTAVIVSTIVIIHLWAYIGIAVIALAVFKAFRTRRHEASRPS